MVRFPLSSFSFFDTDKRNKIALVLGGTLFISGITAMILAGMMGGSYLFTRLLISLYKTENLSQGIIVSSFVFFPERRI